MKTLNEFFYEIFNIKVEEEQKQEFLKNFANLIDIVNKEIVENDETKARVEKLIDNDPAFYYETRLSDKPFQSNEYTIEREIHYLDGHSDSGMGISENATEKEILEVIEFLR